jgi:hypothetical protein
LLCLIPCARARGRRENPQAKPDLVNVIVITVANIVENIVVDLQPGLAGRGHGL